MRLLTVLLLVQLSGPPSIDINTATKEQLTSLPAITSNIADRIIEGRPYKSVDDVQGSVPRFEFDKIRARIFVAASPASFAGAVPQVVRPIHVIPGKRPVQVIQGNKKETIQFDALPEQPPPPVDTK